MKHAGIIQRLGGNRYVGERLGLHRVTVSRWAIIGIPDGNYLSVIALANEFGIRLTLAQLAAGHPRFGKEAISEAVQLLPARSKPRPAAKAKRVSPAQVS